jgi:glycosyltransferase involved in cell wall biosynthesis
MHHPISLLVPCYNAAEYLPSLAKCIASQTMPYAEVVCYDDASTDATAKVAESLGFRVMSAGTNCGPAAARQSLLREAQSEYVHFHDPDDAIDPRFVELMGQSVSLNTAAVCILKDISVDGDETLHPFARGDFNDPPLLLTRRFISYNQTVFPAEVLRQSMVFAHELRLYEDMLAFFSVACAGVQFTYVDKPLTTWIRRRTSLMHRQRILAIDQ